MKKKILYKRALAGMITLVLLLCGSGFDTLAEENTGQEVSATSTDADEEADYIFSYQGEDEPEIDPSVVSPLSCSLDLDSELSIEKAVSSEADKSTYISPYVYATSVRNQSPFNTCWAFATCGAAEADIYTKYGTSVDLSEWQLAYFTAQETVEDPLGGTKGDKVSMIDSTSKVELPLYLYQGGNQLLAIKSIASWRGLVKEDDEAVLYSTIANATDKNITIPSEYAYSESDYHLQNAYIISMKSDRSIIKQNIVKYGACGSAYYYDKSYYNDDTAAEYCSDKTGTNHAITIVGWDDDYDKSNFKSTPSENGAWYVKNSWGTTKNNNGYFWISYEDTSMLSSNAYFCDVVAVGSEDDYTYNYQYDGGVSTTYYSSSAAMYEANVYTAKTNEVLKAVGFYTANTDYSYSISIYVNCADGGYLSDDKKAVATVEGTAAYAGYHTVELGDEIQLDAGTRYSVVIRQEANMSADGTARHTKVEVDKSQTFYSKDSTGEVEEWLKTVSSAEAGQSFLGSSLSSLKDISKSDTANCRIKAFTDPVVDTSEDKKEEDKKTEDKKDNAATTEAEKKQETPTTQAPTTTPTTQTPATQTPTTQTPATQTPATQTPAAQTPTTQTPAAAQKPATQTTSTAAPNVTVSYRTHIQSYGWENTYRTNGAMSGTSGQSKRLEAIQIKVSGNDKLGIQYVTHCQTYGWLSWSSNGEVNGTSGESKRLEAIEIQLTGEDKDKYDVYYRVHAQSYGWLGWAKNGAPAGTAGMSKRLEGIQVIVVKKGESINVNYGNIASKYAVAYVSNGASQTSVSGANSTHVAYQTHVQTYGWQNWKYDGAMSGTSGESKRLESIKIKLTNKDYAGGICYTTHVQTYGWQDNVNNQSTWKRDGEISGTSGESKRLEAIRIKLTGEMAEHYDVYYRVHAQTFGWLGWAKNGEAAGTSGYSKRLEGIEIVLVPKGGNPPGGTVGAFRQK